ncbi:MAG: sugar ABC transporter substrate-binding protein [Opitutaceae bacterium]|nr:sugar ABC transporter substrate-binding protein [Opitutaceae bacterium]
MKTPRLFFAFAVATLVALTGCNRGEPSRTGASGPANAPTVALVVKTLNNPFFIEMQKGAQEAAQKAGVSLIVQAADREVDVERQMQIIENLIERKVGALCITPSGSREIVPVIVKANKAGIPVLIVDTRADEKALAAAGGKTATFIGSDNYDGGKLAGAFIAQKLGGRGHVAVLEGIPGHETGDSRLRGFREAIAQAPGLKIVASQPANWERDQGFNVFQNILQAHPEVNALFACNDLMALGATEAIAAAGKSGRIVVVGFDAQPEAREAIKKGTMAATVAQFAGRMGAIAVENAAKLLRGETIEAFTPVPIELVK